MPVIQNTNSLKAGVLNALMDTWKQKFPVFEEQQKLLMMNLPYKNLRKASYAWKESIPFPTRWDYGTQREYKTFKDRLINVSLTPYQLAIPYSRWDEQDDQLGDMKSHIGMAVDRFLMLPDKMISEYFNGTASLNPSILNCYDGVGVFSTVDGDGNARFGVTGGNIITGSGTKAADIMTDIAAAQRRFLNFLDTASQPIFSEDVVNYAKLHLIVPNSLNEAVQKITNQEFIRSDPSSVTNESNFLWKSMIKYHLNPYLTDTSDYYICVEHNFWKPFVYRQPGSEGLRQIFADESNSDRARETAENALMADIRVGLAPWMPATIIKVNN